MSFSLSLFVYLSINLFFNHAYLKKEGALERFIATEFPISRFVCRFESFSEIPSSDKSAVAIHVFPYICKSHCVDYIHVTYRKAHNFREKFNNMKIEII